MLISYNGIEIGSFWCHEKTGNVYCVLFIANSEGEDIKEKYPVTIVYANVAKSMWQWMTAETSEQDIRDMHGAAEVKVWSGQHNDWHRRMKKLGSATPNIAVMQNRIQHEISEILLSLGGEKFNKI